MTYTRGFRVCNVSQAAITVTTILSSYLKVRSLQLIWRSGTYLWVPDLQMSCRDLTSKFKFFHCFNNHSTGKGFLWLKVAEDDIAFKLAILKKSLHLNDNTCFCSIIQSSKLFLRSLLAKNDFFVQFWTKNFASSRMANCGSGLPAEWPFRSQMQLKRRIRHCPVACG